MKAEFLQQHKGNFVIQLIITGFNNFKIMYFYRTLIYVKYLRKTILHNF